MLKKLLALALAFGLLTGLAAVPAAAAPAYRNPNGCTPDKPCNHSPVIIVPGINQSETFLYVDGEKTDLGGGTVFPDVDAILDFGSLAPAVLALLASLGLQHDIGLTKNIYKLTEQLFEVQRVDLNAKHVHDLRTDIIGRVSDMDEGMRNRALGAYVPAYSVLDVVGDDHMFFFAFNLVGEIWDNVDKLEAYIDYVRKLTGHSKVTLANLSLGGTLFTGYLEKYGHKKLDLVVNIVSAGGGTNLFADLMAMDVNQDPAFLYNDWLPEMMRADIKMAFGWDEALGYGINLLSRVFPYDLYAGVWRAVWTAALDTVMINCTQFWGLIPRERYPALAARWLSDDAHKTVRALTDKYYRAQRNLEKNILAATKDGVYIHNIAGSGLSFGDIEYTFFTPVATRGKIDSDGIVDTALASYGAACAAPGKKLPADYKPNKAGYMSPDGSIDCSTAVLPDTTWIFLNQHHEVGRNDAVLNLAGALVANPAMTVKTNPKKYPQFNPGMHTNDLRRGLIRDGNALLNDPNADLTPVQRKEIEASIREGEAVRALTVGDPARAKAATENLRELLIEHGRRSPAAELTDQQKYVRAFAMLLSQAALDFYGRNGFFEVGSVVRHRWNVRARRGQ